MSRYISAKTKKWIAQRANRLCEYCLLPQRAGFFVFQIEHIISLKHGGTNDPENLAYSCPVCNRSKGTDLGTLTGKPPQLTRFFNPRTDIWNEHFSLDESGEILPRTLIAEATIATLGINDPEQVINRWKLIKAGIMP